ncbi:MAG: diacylglycerol kinase family lipid kinase [Bacteroidales bacterium]|nr:diacylglycerol kinase family lipid kinase [Bacteroidales bacterium]
MNKKIVFIINPKSGTGKHAKVRMAIEKYIDSTKYDFEIMETEYKGHAKEIAKQAVKDKIYMIVSVGGDGTLNEISKALAHTDVILGIIPAGSGNGLAHHLKISTNPRKAIDVINNGKIAEIDTVLLNESRFVSIAGVGFDAFVAWHYDKSEKRGFYPYFKLAFKNFFTYKPKKYIIHINNETIERRAFFITFANSSQWGYNTKIAPTASLKDGKIDVCIFKTPSVVKALLLVPKLFAGKINHSSNMETIQCDCCQVYRSSNKKMHIHIDGEKKKRKQTVTLRLEPKSLKIIVPQNYHNE